MSWIHEDDTIRIAKLSVGPFDNNAYVVVCARTNTGVIIDAASEGERILEVCQGVDISLILTTHGHQDHIAALDEVKDSLGIPWAMHLADIEIAERQPDQPIEDRQVFEVGEIALHAVHTPGHTPGSMSFIIEPVVFSGDTLFPGGPGATRWEYSSFGQVMDSIEDGLMALPDTTLVHPGHGGSTTIGTERPSVPEWRARGW